MKVEYEAQDVDYIYSLKDDFIGEKISYIAVDGHNGTVSRVVIYAGNGKSLYWANGTGWTVESWDKKAEHNRFPKSKRNWLQQLLRLR